MSKTRIPQIIAMLLALAIVVAFFLPYINMTEEYSQYLDSRGSEKVYDSADLTVGEMKEMSLFEYAKVYLQAGKEIFRNESAGLLYAVLIGAIGVFAILAFLCAWGKKPILLFITSALSGAAFYVTNWDFMERGIMPNSNSVWGIAHEIILPIAIAMLLCAIWMLIAKRSEKKANS